MYKNLITVCSLLLAICTPQLSGAEEALSIQGLNDVRTAEYVNGLAMAFSLYDLTLQAQKKPRLFCLPPGETVGASQIWELASSALKGPHEKQVVAIAALDELKNRFPCNP
jgi:hypothetical protein